MCSMTAQLICVSLARWRSGAASITTSLGGQILRHARQQETAGRPLVVQLTGAGTSSKPMIAREVARELKLGLYCLSIENLPIAPGRSRPLYGSGNVRPGCCPYACIVK
jgi:hypothetical protein